MPDLHPGDETSVAGGTLIGYFDWFALGMGLAIVSVAAKHRRSRIADWIAGHPAIAWLAAAVAFAPLIA